VQLRLNFVQTLVNPGFQSQVGLFVMLGFSAQQHVT
jgi:hypothetical protein